MDTVAQLSWIKMSRNKIFPIPDQIFCSLTQKKTKIGNRWPFLFINSEACEPAQKQEKRLLGCSLRVSNGGNIPTFNLSSNRYLNSSQSQLFFIVSINRTSSSCISVVLASYILFPHQISALDVNRSGRLLLHTARSTLSAFGLLTSGSSR